MKLFSPQFTASNRLIDRIDSQYRNQSVMRDFQDNYNYESLKVFFPGMLTHDFLEKSQTSICKYDLHSHDKAFKIEQTMKFRKILFY